MKPICSDWVMEQSTIDPFSRAFGKLNLELPGSDEPDPLLDSDERQRPSRSNA